MSARSVAYLAPLQALTRSEDYKLKKGDWLALKYRLVVYTGDLDKKLIEKAWKEFTAKKK